MGLGDFAGAVDDALLDASVVDDETLVVCAGTAYVARSASEDFVQGGVEGVDERRFGADPRGAGGVTFGVFIAKAGKLLRAAC